MNLMCDFVFALGEEWMSLLAGAAATFVVFVMGIPALISQTFIPDGLRSLHKERIESKWSGIFWSQIRLILVLLILASPISKHLCNAFGSWNWLLELVWAIAFFLLTRKILIQGTKHLAENFDTSRNIGEHLTQIIIENATKNLHSHGEISKKDIDALGVVSKEIPQGAVKNTFLDECETLINLLLNRKSESRTIHTIGEILEKAISPCVNTDDTKANEENIRKALGVLIRAYQKTQPSTTKESLRLRSRIVDSIREIGIKAIDRGDHSSFLYATEEITNGMASHYDINKEVIKEDIEAIGHLAKELPHGTTKHEFLEQCEALLEHLLDAKGKKDYEAVGEILEKVVYPSINAEDVDVTEGNVCKALDIMSLAYNKMHLNPKESNSYLALKIGGYIREIGAKSIQRGDLFSFKYAVDKLSNIEGASKEMYALGDAALKGGHMPEAVSMVRTLGSRVRQKSSMAGLPLYKDKVAYAWLGLVVRIGKQGFSAANFADIQITSLLSPIETQPEFLKSFFTDAKNHFYRLADFSTADAILELQQKRYPA